MAREKELAKVSIKNEDVDLIVQELEIPKSKAERTLREFQGNIVEAMASLTNWLIFSNFTMLILVCKIRKQTNKILKITFSSYYTLIDPIFGLFLSD